MKHLGLVSILFLWAVVGAVVSYFYEPEYKTFSQMLTNKRKAYWTITASLVIFSVTFYLFMDRWFIPTYQLSNSVRYIAAATLLCQFLAVVILDKPGWQWLPHRLLAYCLAFLLLIFAVIIDSSPIILNATHTTTVLLTALMGILLGKMVIFPKDKSLVQQALYGLCFQILVLSAVYIR